MVLSSRLVISSQSPVRVPPIQIDIYKQSVTSQPKLQGLMGLGWTELASSEASATILDRPQRKNTSMHPFLVPTS